MSSLKEFKQWYGDYLAEAVPTNVPKPYAVPDDNTFLGRMQRGAMNAWSNWKGQGDIDWDARTQANDAANRKYQAQKAAGDPDDPQVQEQKARGFGTTLAHELVRSTPGAEPKTAQDIERNSLEFAQTVTMGRRIMPTPIAEMIRSVQADASVAANVKEGLWKNYETLMPQVWRVWNNNPQFWYNPQATRKEDQFPAGSKFDPQEWTVARNSLNQSKPEKVNVKATLQQRGIGPNMMSQTHIDKMIQDIINAARSKGQEIEYSDLDQRELQNWGTTVGQPVDIKKEIEALGFTPGSVSKSQLQAHIDRLITKARADRRDVKFDDADKNDLFSTLVGKVPAYELMTRVAGLRPGRQSWMKVYKTFLRTVRQIEGSGQEVELGDPRKILALANDLPPDPGIQANMIHQLRNAITP